MNTARTHHSDNTHGLYLVPRTAPFIIGCPRSGCSFESCAGSEGSAIRLLAHHLVHDHMQAPVETQGAA